MGRLPKGLREFARVLLSPPTPKDVESVLVNTRAGVLITILNAFVYVISHDFTHHFLFIAVWFASTVALCSVIFVRSSQALSQQVTHVSRRAARRLILFAVLIALPWATLAFFEVGYGSDSERFLVFLVTAGMAAGGTFMLYRALAVALAFFVTIQLALVSASFVCCGREAVPVLLYSFIYFASLMFFSYGAGKMARQRDTSVDALSDAVADLEIAHEKNHKLAYADDVTGLPNRKSFMQKLEQATLHMKRSGAPFTILMFDLDRFKNINDTFGHSIGDELLAYVGVRVRNELRSNDLIARLGGDEFAILLPGLVDTGRIEGFVERLGAQLKAPVTLAGRLIYTGASFGAATCPEHGQSAEELLLNADLALNQVKETERGKCLIFDSQLRDKIMENDWLEKELRDALREQDIVVAYQPQVSLTDGSITGAEALVRWSHTDRGPIAPDVFLTLAAERGLMPTVSRYIADAIKRDILAWRADGLTPPQIAMNIHPMDFRNPGVLFDTIARLTDAGITPDDILLEITEGCFLGRGTDAAMFLLDELADRGFELSLDDFGTGHASISHLKKLPVTEIKIDRSFVMGITEDPKDRAIVSATAEIARGMGIRSVAEGVEDDAQRDLLLQLGIDVGQGYFWARPLLPQDFAAFLHDHCVSERGSDAVARLAPVKQVKSS